MRGFAKICASLAALLCAACSSAPELPAPESAHANSYTLAQKRLLYIVDQQNRFFESAKSKSRLARSDAVSAKSRIDSLWTEYLTDFPNDAEALAIRGKFLRAIGDFDGAHEAFTKADRANPNLASVKQQLANYEAERGNPESARENLKAAISLAPGEAVYREQLADLLLFYREELVYRKKFSQSFVDAEMIDSMRAAAELKPEDPRIQWKYARFFYDVGKPDWRAALAQWNLVLEKFAPMRVDRQTALANKARVLIELDRDAEAGQILKTIDLQSLSDDAKKLMSVIEESKKKKSK